MYIYILVYTSWNLFVLYFGGWTLQNKALFKQNNGHLGYLIAFNTKPPSSLILSLGGASAERSIYSSSKGRMK